MATSWSGVCLLPRSKERQTEGDGTHIQAVIRVFVQDEEDLQWTPKSPPSFSLGVDTHISISGPGAERKKTNHNRKDLSKYSSGDPCYLPASCLPRKGSVCFSTVSRVVVPSILVFIPKGQLLRFKMQKQNHPEHQKLSRVSPKHNTER